jgi:hypothetical protein
MLYVTLGRKSSGELWAEKNLSHIRHGITRRHRARQRLFEGLRNHLCFRRTLAVGKFSPNAMSRSVEVTWTGSDWYGFFLLSYSLIMDAIPLVFGHPVEERTVIAGYYTPQLQHRWFCNERERKHVASLLISSMTGILYFGSLRIRWIWEELYRPAVAWRFQKLYYD